MKNIRIRKDGADENEHRIQRFRLDMAQKTAYGGVMTEFEALSAELNAAEVIASRATTYEIFEPFMFEGPTERIPAQTMHQLIYGETK